MSMRLSFKVGPLIISRSLDRRRRPAEPERPTPAYRPDAEPAHHRVGPAFWFIVVPLLAYGAWIIWDALS